MASDLIRITHLVCFGDKEKTYLLDLVCNHLYKYLHKCEDTYSILQNKYLCIYKDSFGAKIVLLGVDWALSYFKLPSVSNYSVATLVYKFLATLLLLPASYLYSSVYQLNFLTQQHCKILIFLSCFWKAIKALTLKHHRCRPLKKKKKMVKKIENKILPTRDKYTSFLYLDSSMYKLTLIFHQQTATSWHAKTGIFILLLLYFCLFFQNKFSCFEFFGCIYLTI